MQSFNEVARSQLERLWRAVHGEALPPPVLPVPDDGRAPYELSLLLGRAGPELCLRAGPWTPGVPLAGPDVDLARLEAVADLFRPEPAEAGAAPWWSARFDAAGKPSWQVHLDPTVRGRHHAPRLVEEALARLGCDGAFATVTRALPRGPDLDELRWFVIDLDAREAVRVEVRSLRHDVTVDELARALELVPGADADAVREFVRTLAGGDGALRAPAQPSTWLSFVPGEPLPRGGAVHVPVGTFADGDEDAHRRVARALGALGIEPEPLLEALGSSEGAIAWAALGVGQASGVQVGLAPRAGSDAPTRAGRSPGRAAEAVELVVRECERRPVSAHPLFARLAREPFDLRKLALMVLNIREAITLHFSRRLASVIARVEEDDLRSVLAKQLDDELGHGDPTRTHKVLFERFVEGVRPWAPDPLLPHHLEPGRAFGLVQEELYLRRSPYEGLGATLIMEVFGRDADLAMGKQFRRGRDELPPDVLEWLTLHEELEIDHVDESYELARSVPRGNASRLAARGAEEMGAAGWAFCDALYRTCYGGA